MKHDSQSYFSFENTQTDKNKINTTYTIGKEH